MSNSTSRASSQGPVSVERNELTLATTSTMVAEGISVVAPNSTMNSNEESLALAMTVGRREPQANTISTIAPDEEIAALASRTVVERDERELAPGKTAAAR